eukprot:5195468-Pyramimonas_sp.AAC.1
MSTISPSDSNSPPHAPSSPSPLWSKSKARGPASAGSSQGCAGNASDICQVARAKTAITVMVMANVAVD